MFSSSSFFGWFPTSLGPCPALCPAPLLDSHCTLPWHFCSNHRGPRDLLLLGVTQSLAKAISERKEALVWTLSLKVWSGILVGQEFEAAAHCDLSQEAERWSRYSAHFLHEGAPSTCRWVFLAHSTQSRDSPTDLSPGGPHSCHLTGVSVIPSPRLWSWITGPVCFTWVSESCVMVSLASYRILRSLQAKPNFPHLRILPGRM